MRRFVIATTSTSDDFDFIEIFEFNEVWLFYCLSNLIDDDELERLRNVCDEITLETSIKAIFDSFIDAIIDFEICSTNDNDVLERELERKRDRCAAIDEIFFELIEDLKSVNNKSSTIL